MNQRESKPHEIKTDAIYDIIKKASNYNKDFGYIGEHSYCIVMGYDGMDIKPEYLETGNKSPKRENATTLPDKIKNTSKLLELQKMMFIYVEFIQKDIDDLNKQIDEIRNN